MEALTKIIKLTINRVSYKRENYRVRMSPMSQGDIDECEI